MMISFLLRQPTVVQMAETRAGSHSTRTLDIYIVLTYLGNIEVDVATILVVRAGIEE